MTLNEVKAAVLSAGVVGAGGAGFPTHYKLAENIDTVLVNAAECEPLLHTDTVILQRHLKEVVQGAQSFALSMGAKQVLLCVKKHNAELVGLLEGQKIGEGVGVKVLPDVYPMGDEIVMIYEALGRVVPPGQLPSFVGVVVINAETALNIDSALQNTPVTHTWLTVGGNIPEACVVRAPVGCSVGDLLKKLDVIVPEGNVVLDGGPAMGKIVSLDAHITKKTKALLVLPETCAAVADKLAKPARQIKRTPSACCQCTMCTDMCPRHLLGHPIQPHKTLRSAATLAEYQRLEDLQTASLCCGCGLCTFVACCQGVTPSAVMMKTKAELGKNRLAYRSETPTIPKAERAFRMVSSSRFASLLGVAKYDKQAEYKELASDFATYTLLLSQHVGKPSVPCVEVGQSVKLGDCIANADSGISAALHAPIAGTVVQLRQNAIVIQPES